MASPLGLLIPKRPIRTDFVQVSPTRWVITIEAPSAVPELAIFLLPGQTLPHGAGLAYFWSLPPHTDWVALGSTTGAAPSGIFRTGWPSTPEVAAAPLVQLGVSLEAEHTAESLGVAAASDKGLATLLAADLASFLGSFSTVDPMHGERLLVPPAALDTWLRRVQETASGRRLHPHRSLPSVQRNGTARWRQWRRRKQQDTEYGA